MTTTKDIVDRLMDAEHNYVPDVSSFDDLIRLFGDARGEIIELRVRARMARNALDGAS